MGGDDVLIGGGGNDRIGGGDGADRLEGGAGSDYLFSTNRPTDAAAYLQMPNRSLDAGADVDTLLGGTDDDFIFAGYGDFIDGGALGFRGNWLSINFQGATSGVTADFRPLETSGGSITIGGG